MKRKKIIVLFSAFLIGCQSNINSNSSINDSSSMTDSSSFNDSTPPSSDSDSIISTTPEEYTITFIKQGGLGGSSSVVATLGQAMPTAAAPAKTSYNFLGYFDASEGGKKYYNNDMTSAENWDKTTNSNLYAQWTMKQIDPSSLKYNLINDSAYSVEKGSALMEGVLTIPKEYDGLPVTTIVNAGFADSPNLLIVIFEATSNISIINTNAFQNCTGLTSIAFPNSVLTMYSGILRGCSGITSLTIPFVGQSRTGSGSAMLLGWIFGSTSYSESTATSQYDSSSSVATYYIPNALKTIILTDATFLHYGAFYGCSNITSISLSDNLVTIGSRAFYNTKISSISISETVTSIASRAFDWCDNLASINVDINNNYYYSNEGVLYNKDVSKLLRYAPAKTDINHSIPSTVAAIGEYAFHNAKNLKNVEIPNSVLTIELASFNGCSGLTSMTLPFVGYSRTTTDNFGQFGYIFGGASYTGGVYTTQYQSSSSVAYYYIPANLKTITITDTTKLFYGAFSGCSNIININLPAMLTTIGARAFYNTTGVTNLTILGNITSIGSEAFYGWSSTQKLNFIVDSSVSTTWDSNWNKSSNANVTWNYSL